MSYSIKVLNPSLVEIGTLKNIKDVEIYEVINNQYTADLSIVENVYPSFLQFPNILEIDDDYFIIANIDKQRDNSKSIRLSLEHVSYMLNNPSLAPSIDDETEEFYEGSIVNIISNIWGGLSQYTIQVVGADGYYYYRPNTKGGRSRIQEFARQNGFEVVYNKFTITVRDRRGDYKGLVLRTGENIRSVSQKIELNEDFNIEYAHEVDIIDFGRMTGSQQQAIFTAELGDTVRIIDTDLAINATERIIARRYNPLFKQVPKLEVGQVARDIINIINDDKEQEKQEDNPSANYFLQTWQIGQVNCMSLSGIELDAESVLPGSISTSVDYYIDGEHKGMTLAVKSQYRNYHVYIGEWYEDNRYEEYKLENVANVIGTWNFPKPKMQAISITVSEVPLEKLNPEIHQVMDYGIKFNKVYIDPLREFRIGKKNVLGLNGLLIDTNGESIELDDFSAKLDYHLMQEYEGLKISLRREFQNYKVTIMTFSSDGIPFMHDYNAIKDQLPTWKLPREDAEYLLVSITEVPSSGAFDPTVHKTVMYGIKFEKVPFLPLYEFRVGEINCLQLNGVSVSSSPSLNTIQAELFYKKLIEHKGLRLTLLREYRSYYIGIQTYSSKGKGTEQEYTDITDWSYPKKSVMYIVVSILEKPPDEFDSTKHKQAWYAIKFTEQSDEVNNPIGPKYYLESETVSVGSGGAEFLFTAPYDDVVSVTTGIGDTTQTAPMTPIWELIKDENGKFIGVTVELIGLESGSLNVSIQAMCQDGIDEEGEDDDV